MPDSPPDTSGPPDPQVVAELVARYVEVCEQDGAAAAEALLDAAPGLATAARLQLARLQAAGLLRGGKAAGPEPRRIGPYTVLERLGTGGMGEVYLAEQREPVRRRVALKVIKLGMTSRDVLARFDQERQALALMSHAHIARVYEAGTTDDGSPYFAMEHVAGPPLTVYCDRRQLDTRARLQLMLAVCDAVQHAHYKGVIHRDLKPSNVLVMEQDGVAVPKVIDFGVAKAVGAALGDGSVHTARDMVVGTPEYMSPEQAGRGELDIDTRTDVYSLGVMLFELLTGSLPFPSARLRSGGLEQMLSIIRDEPPPRPSTRVSPTTQDGDKLARARSTDLATLQHHLRGDLDWIVLKAIDKDRMRRYQTPAALAADLRHYLADEPVEARPPSFLYRARKFVARYRAAVALASLALLALVGGLIVSLVFRARAEANAAAAVVAQNEAEIARQIAETNFDSAVRAVDDLLSRVGEQSLAQIPQMELVRRDLLQRALRFYEQFAAQRSNDRAVRMRLALAHDRMGKLQQLLGDNRAAANMHRRAIALFDELAQQAPSPRIAVARALALSELSRAVRDFDDVAQARTMLDEAIAALRAVSELTTEDRRQLAALLLDRGQLERPVDMDRADAMLREGVAEMRAVLSADDISGRATLTHNELVLATTALVRGESTTAEELLLRIVEDTSALAGRAPERLDVRQAGCAALDQLAILYHDTGRPAQAEQSARRGIAGWAELAKAFPNTVELRSRHARALANLAGMFESVPALGRAEEVARILDEALGIEQALVQAMPDNSTFRYRLAKTQISVGRRGVLSQDHVRQDRGLELLNSARQIGEQLAALDKSRPEYVRLQIDVLQLTARLHDRRQQFDRAREDLAVALTIGRELVRAHPSLLEVGDAHAMTLHMHGDLELRQGHFDAALAAAEEALALLRPALAREARQPSRRQRGYEVFELRLRALVFSKRTDEARRALEDLRGFVQTGSERYAAARLAMACAASPELRADTSWYESAALAELRAAQAAGYRDVARVTAEPLFAPLREHAEFQAVLEAMRQK